MRGGRRQVDWRLFAISPLDKDATGAVSCQSEKSGDYNSSEAMGEQLDLGLNQPAGKKESSKFSKYSSRSARVNAVYNQRRNATSSSSSVR